MFDFSKFCEIGDILAQIDDEAYIRSAIGRYYYSILCCARIYLVEIKNEYEFRSKHNIHRKICDYLMSSKNDTEQSIGEILDELREIRGYADYDWENKNYVFFASQLNDTKRNTKLVLDQINALKKSPPFDL